MCREHDVGSHDGGVHVGEVATVVLADPRLVRGGAEHEDPARAKREARERRESRDGVRVLHDPQVPRLPVDRRGRGDGGVDERLDLLGLDGRVGEGADGVVVARKLKEAGHGSPFLWLPRV